MASKILLRLFNLPIIGNRLLWFITDRTGKDRELAVIREYVKQRRGVEVGLYSYGGCFEPEFCLGGRVTIGRYSSLASCIRYFGANHPISAASTSPYFYNQKISQGVQDVHRSSLTIGNDCWIGYGVIITCGCSSIGNGAIIGAGSVVTKDVPPYAVVAGVPARIIRYRFDKDVADALERSRWWDLSPSDILPFASLIDDPLSFCAAVAAMKEKINNTSNRNSVQK